MKVYIRTFGCQMNERDSGGVGGALVKAGYVLVDSPEEANVILVNTCAVRAHAEDRVFSLLGVYKKFKLKRGGLPLEKDAQKIIGVIGCMAKDRGKEIFEKIPYVDAVCGPAVLDRIPEYLEKIAQKHVRIIDIGDRTRKEVFYTHDASATRTRAQVVISTGCSNHCTYCVVPLVRGEIRLRKPEDIIAEIKRNVVVGNKNITLLGQNVNDYRYRNQKPEHRYQNQNRGRGNETNFIELLRMAADVAGVESLDFFTSHPKNTSIALFTLIAKHPTIKKHLHLPFQSGSDKILKAMHRGYTRGEYLRLVREYRRIVGASLGTDIIVGFPGETEDDFQDTLEVVKTVGFDCAYIFKYSPRPGTAAEKLPDDVPKKEKERRHAIVLALQKKMYASRGSG